MAIFPDGPDSYLCIRIELETAWVLTEIKIVQSHRLMSIH